jgi:cellulose biosynthesis protein BcsQ
MLITVANLAGGLAQSSCAVNLACELAGVEHPGADRWQSSHRVILFDANPGSGVVNYYCSGNTLPVACDNRRLADSDLNAWIESVRAIAAGVDYFVMLGPMHSESVTSALIEISDLILVPYSVSAPDLPVIATTIELIRVARRARADLGPQCLLVPTRSSIGSMNEVGTAGSLKLGEPLGPLIDGWPEFKSAYSERRWIGDFAWGSPAHGDIRALAVGVRHELAAPACRLEAR